MKQFYLVFPILDALRPELSWTQYRTLMRVEDSTSTMAKPRSDEKSAHHSTAAPNLYQLRR